MLTVEAMKVRKKICTVRCQWDLVEMWDILIKRKEGNKCKM